MRKTCAERRKITILKDVKIRKRFEEKVTKLVDVGAPNLGDSSRMGFQRHVERRGGGEVKEIHGGGMKR